MHHLQELNRKRPLYLTLLTPEDLAAPSQKSFIINSKVSGSDADPDTKVPLLPLKARVNHHLAKESEKTFEEDLFERRRERIKNSLSGRKMIHKEGCPTCGQDHIQVQYYGYRHVCLRCREFIETRDGHPVKIILDKEGNIIAFTFDERKQVKYVDFQKLVVFNKDCFASLAGLGELIVLIYEE